MKKFLLIFMTLSLLLNTPLFEKCNNNGEEQAYLENNIEVTTSTSACMMYTVFDGSRTYEADINEDTAIKVDVETYDGELYVDICASDGTSPYTGRITENMSFTVNVKAGYYMIVLDGNNHSGSFKFDWSNKNSEE